MNQDLKIPDSMYAEVFDALLKYPPGDKRRKSPLVVLMAYDITTATCELHPEKTAWMSMVGDDNIYRVQMKPDGIYVVCFGLESIDSCLSGHYDRIDDLPNWVKERLAILNMMSSTPPTNEVEGVGRRISERVYWVFAPNPAQTSTSA